MLTCCKNDSSVINLIYSGQPLFSYTRVKVFEVDERTILEYSRVNKHH